MTNEQGAAAFDWPFRAQETNAPHGYGASSSGHFEPSAALGQARAGNSIDPVASQWARAVNSCAPAKPSGFEVGNADTCEAPVGDRAFGAFCGSKPSSSSNLEPAAAPVQVRGLRQQIIACLAAMQGEKCEL